MNTQFYIVSEGNQKGPYSFDELKNLNLKRDSLVWHEGMENWKKAESVDLLKELFKTMPPPIPSEESKTKQTTPPPIPDTTKASEKYFGYELALKQERFFALIIEALILLIPYLLIIGDSDAYSFTSIIGGTLFSAICGAIFYPIWSSNLGHKILGLKVISSEDGKDQNNAGIGALREALKSIFSLVLIPVMWLLWDDNRQNLYDIVVKTYVVKRDKKK